MVHPNHIVVEHQEQNAVQQKRNADTCSCTSLPTSSRTTKMQEDVESTNIMRRDSHGHGTGTGNGNGNGTGAAEEDGEEDGGRVRIYRRGDHLREQPDHRRKRSCPGALPPATTNTANTTTSSSDHPCSESCPVSRQDNCHDHDHPAPTERYYSDGTSRSRRSNSRSSSRHPGGYLPFHANSYYSNEQHNRSRRYDHYLSEKQEQEYQEYAKYKKRYASEDRDYRTQRPTYVACTNNRRYEYHTVAALPPPAPPPATQSCYQSYDSQHFSDRPPYYHDERGGYWGVNDNYYVDDRRYRYYKDYQESFRHGHDDHHHVCITDFQCYGVGLGDTNPRPVGHRHLSTVSYKWIIYSKLFPSKSSSLSSKAVRCCWTYSL